MMKLLNNLKTLFTDSVATKDFTLRLSQLGAVWDKGLGLFGSGGKGRPAKPYASVEWVWICVNLLIDICRSVPLMISTADDEVVESGPLYDFIYNKNFQRQLAETIGFYVLFREVYWITLDSTGLSPTNMLVAGPYSCRPEVRSGVVVGYRLSLAGGKSVVLFPEDVYVIKNFNPYDANHGLGPLEAGTMAISTAYQASQYNESSLANGARISVVLTVPQGTKLDDEEIRRLKSEFSSQQAGARNAGKAFLASGISDIKTLSQTMADLQMVDMSKFTANTICALFGVPPECVGLITEAQYAQGPATQRLVLYCISPLLEAISDAINEGIVERYKYKSGLNKCVAFARSRINYSRQPIKSRQLYRRLKSKAMQAGSRLFAWFDVDSHPAIQEMLRDRAAKMLQYVDKGVPLNQVIDAGDLPFDTTEIPWGNDWLVSMGLVTARSIIDGSFDATGGSLPEGQGDGEEETLLKPADEDAPPVKSVKIVNKDSLKKRIWERYIASWLPIEKEFQESIRGLFRKQQKELLSKLAAALAESGLKNSVNQCKSVSEKADTSAVIARVVFDLVEQNKKIRVINRVFFQKASVLGAAQTLTETAGLKGDALKEAVRRTQASPAIRRSLEISSAKLSKVNATTQAWVAQQLRTGLEKDEGIRELTDRLTGIFGRTRAGAIARTQSAGAVSSGRFAGMKEAGVEKKGWLTSHDERVRPEHRAAEADYTDGIPLDQPFIVGGDRLMYPADPNGSIGMIANCRCLQTAVFAAGKSISLDDYDRMKFVSYAEIKTLLTEVQNAKSV